MTVEDEQGKQFTNRDECEDQRDDRFSHVILKREERSRDNSRLEDFPDFQHTTSNYPCDYGLPNFWNPTMDFLHQKLNGKRPRKTVF